jgi:glycosyltransferase involved in cell wall biosynthesis
MLHNYYQQSGGEDQVFEAESNLLASFGDTVSRYTVANQSIKAMRRYKVVKDTIWSTQSYNEIRRLIRQEAPDIMHVHNNFPRLSPSVYYAAKEEKVAVVQSLHNYRHSCVNGLFFRNGAVCEDCLGLTAPVPGVLRGCYRDSRSGSAVVAAMLTYHKLRKTYGEMVDVYVALSAFSRRKFVEAGLPSEKIVVKPNFVDPDPGLGDGSGDYALFVGRLSSEKGIRTLLAAWRQIGPSLPLWIVGDGPLAEEVQRATEDGAGVVWMKRRPRREVISLMSNAKLLVLPSVCYENFPMTIAEAFAVGLPVVASRQGAIQELVDSGRTGLHFLPGDSSDLARKVSGLVERPAELAPMRRAARLDFEAKYSAKENYRQLMAIYEQAKERSRA